MSEEVSMLKRVMSARPGDNVRYLFAHRMHGVLLRRSMAHGGGWLVRWEDGNILTAAYENLELIEGGNQ